MPERDQLEVDVLFVGAGPASLAGAIRLGQLAQGRPVARLRFSSSKRPARSAIMGFPAPSWIRARSTNSCRTGATARRSNRRSPATNCGFSRRRKNAGAADAAAVAQSRQVRRIAAEHVRMAGENARRSRRRKCFRHFPDKNCLWDGDRVIGVRTGDKGLDHDGKPKANYEPGADILAKVVVLGEGPRGTLAKQAIARLDLDAGTRTASLRGGRQRVVAASRRSFQSRRGDPHAGLSACRRKRSAADSSTAWPATSSTSAWSPVWITPTRRPIRTTNCSA